MNNPTQFARADGEGFRFLTGFVADMETRNPQVAARLLTAFRIWGSFEPVRRTRGGNGAQVAARFGSDEPQRVGNPRTDAWRLMKS